MDQEESVTRNTRPTRGAERALEVTIPGACVPCPRPRVTRFRTYMSERYTLWHEAAQWQLKSGEPWDCSVEVEAVCWGVRMNADVDNLLKSVMDALTGTVIKDDRQVMRATIVKAAGAPMTTIRVKEIP